MHCTASPLLEAAEPEQSSAYADEGTLAHALAAKRLKTLLGRDTAAEDAEIASLWEKYHTGEMDEAVQFYTDRVLEFWYRAKQHTPDAALLVEVRLDFSSFIPESFGTSDAVIVGDGTIEVIDLKYGKGVPVAAKGNPQMRIYALGAVEAYESDYDIRPETRVRTTIIQPRLDSVSTDAISVHELRGWARCELTDAANEAYNGGRQRTGDWCRFCKVQSKCTALAKKAEWAMSFDSPFISPDQAARLLDKLPAIKAFISAFEDRCLSFAVSGEGIPGYKLVHGRSVRKITNPEGLIERLSAAGYDPEAYMRPAELDTITNLEKSIGKKTLASLAKGCITKPEGKPTLVPESDPREPINTALDDFKDEFETTAKPD